MTQPDYYELLGVPADATADEIRDAYRRAVRTAHPDAGGTAGMFRLVTHAYETLRDPAGRAAYDASRNGDLSGSTAMSDAEEDIEFDVFDADGSVDPGWGTETTWDADIDLEDGREFPRERLLKWAAHSDVAHRARTLSWWIGPFLFAACAGVLIFPDVIRPAAATPDAFSWILQLPVVTLIVIAFYVYVARSMIIGVLEAYLLPHALATIGFLVWPMAYWDIATVGERLIYGSFFVAFLLYLVALSTICIVNQADQDAERGLL